MLLVEAHGIPVALTIRSAQQSEMKLALEVVDLSPKKPKRVVADRGYDWQQLRKDLRSRNITPYIPKRQGWNKDKPRKPMSKQLTHWYRNCDRPTSQQRWADTRAFLQHRTRCMLLGVVAVNCGRQAPPKPDRQKQRSHRPAPSSSMHSSRTSPSIRLARI